MIKQLKLVTKDGNNLEMKNCPYSLGVEMIACSMSDEAIRAAIKSLEHKLMCRAKGSAEAPEPQHKHTWRKEQPDTNQLPGWKCECGAFVVQQMEPQEAQG